MDEFTSPRVLSLLVGEDRPDLNPPTLSIQSIQKTIGAKRAKSHMSYVNRAGDLLDYLYGNHPRPDLILLDLDFDNKAGLQLIQQIKIDPLLRTIPLIALTHSPDMSGAASNNAYACGASCCILKPEASSEITQMFADLEHYWLEVVKLPNERNSNGRVYGA